MSQIGCIYVPFLVPFGEIDWEITWQAIGAIGTLAAIWFALYHDTLKDWFFGPKLQLTLRDENGHFVELMDQAGKSLTPKKHALYYHFQLLNSRTVVKNPGIYIVGVNDSGAIKRIAPLRFYWAHEPWHRATALTPDMAIPEWNFCDIVEIKEDESIPRFRTTFVASEFSNVIEQGRERTIYIRIYASNFTKKEIWELTVKWDGPVQPFTKQKLSSALHLKVHRCSKKTENHFR